VTRVIVLLSLKLRRLQESLRLLTRRECMADNWSKSRGEEVRFWSLGLG
jgi:hypothetical protein